MGLLLESINRTMTLEQFEAIVAKHKLNIFGGGRCGKTPLTQIVEQGNLQLAQLLIQKYGRILVCIGNEFGYTPMHAAASLERETEAIAFVRMLEMYAGDIANVNICTSQGKTVLECARDVGHKKLAQLLIASYHAVDDDSPN